jgi:hypothetical protein
MKKLWHRDPSGDSQDLINHGSNFRYSQPRALGGPLLGNADVPIGSVPTKSAHAER